VQDKHYNNYPKLIVSPLPGQIIKQYSRALRLASLFVWLKQAFVLMELQSSFSINILIRYWNRTQMQFFIFLVFEDFFNYSLDFDIFRVKTGTIFSFFTFFRSHKLAALSKYFHSSLIIKEWLSSGPTKWQLVWMTLKSLKEWTRLATVLLSPQVVTNCHPIDFWIDLSFDLNNFAWSTI